MFRDCYFEYKGIYSGDYNLKLFYIDDSYNKRNSGGEYSNVINSNNNRIEKLLYTREYTPLEFDIEIINPDEIIPFEQMIEIKKWLYDSPIQWNDLKIFDSEYKDIVFRCTLIPNEDFCDSMGYRGLKCHVQCNSPFGYKETIHLQFNRWDKGQSQRSLSSFDFAIDCDIATQNCLPTIKLTTIANSLSNKYNNMGVIINTTNNSCLWIYNLRFDRNNDTTTTIFGYSGVLTNTGSTAKGNQWLNLGKKTFNELDSNDKIVQSFDLDCGLLQLSSGVNNLKFYGVADKLEVIYTPTVRVGAF